MVSCNSILGACEGSLPSLWIAAFEGTGISGNEYGALFLLSKYSTTDKHSPHHTSFSLCVHMAMKRGRENTLSLYKIHCEGHTLMILSKPIITSQRLHLQTPLPCEFGLQCMYRVKYMCLCTGVGGRGNLGLIYYHQLNGKASK